VSRGPVIYGVKRTKCHHIVLRHMVLIDWVLGFVSDMTKMVSFPATSRGKSDFIRIEGVN
jgi:hypothetical protein